MKNSKASMASWAAFTVPGSFLSHTASHLKEEFLCGTSLIFHFWHTPWWFFCPYHYHETVSAKATPGRLGCLVRILDLILWGVSCGGFIFMFPSPLYLLVLTALSVDTLPGLSCDQCIQEIGCEHPLWTRHCTGRREIGKRGWSDLGLKWDPPRKGTVVGMIKIHAGVSGQVLRATSSGRGVPEAFSEKAIGPLLKTGHILSRGSRRKI